MRFKVSGSSSNLLVLVFFQMVSLAVIFIGGVMGCIYVITPTQKSFSGWKGWLFFVFQLMVNC